MKGRQYTGRIVTVSNKATFTEPVFNYSAMFDFIWEEVSFPIAYRSDWRKAEEILRDEAEKTSRAEGAELAMQGDEPQISSPEGRGGAKGFCPRY